MHHNLFYQPEKWLGRILQETRDQQFKPCQRGLVERNVVATDQRVSVFFNVGKGNRDPESFVFRENLCFRPDGSNRPDLPTFEKDGVYDIDPWFLPHLKEVCRSILLRRSSAESARCVPALPGPDGFYGYFSAGSDNS